MSYKNSSKSNRPSDSQEVLLIIRNPGVHYPIHNIPPPAHILSWINLFHAPPLPFRNGHKSGIFYILFIWGEKQSDLEADLSSTLSVELRNAQI